MTAHLLEILKNKMITLTRNTSRIIWILLVTAIALFFLLIVGLRSCSTSNANMGKGSLNIDTASVNITSYTQDEMIIREFITNMYNDRLFEEYGFLETHCSKHLLEVLEEDYEFDGVGYAVWDFRTSAQDSKPGSEEGSKVCSVESIGDDWYVYEFYDGGWEGKKRLKASVIDGEIVMDAIETIYDECEEAISNE